MAKIDVNGNLIWERSIAGQITSAAVALDQSNSVFISGTQKFGASASDIMPILEKYDSAGNLHWHLDYATLVGSTLVDLEVASSGNIYIGSSVSGGAASFGDFRLTQLDSTGTLVWDQTYVSGAPDILRDIAIDSTENIILTGWTRGGFLGNTQVGLTDIPILKVDSSGTVLWSNLIGTVSADSGSAVVVDTAGEIFVSGGTAGNLDGNSNLGGQDYFIIKLDSLGNLL